MGCADASPGWSAPRTPESRTGWTACIDRSWSVSVAPVHSCGRAAAAVDLSCGADHVVHEPVLLSLLGREPAVPVRVTLDRVHGLAGVTGDQLGHLALRVEHLLGLNLDVGCGPAEATGRLMHHDPRVRECVSLAGRSGAEQ